MTLVDPAGIRPPVTENPGDGDSPYCQQYILLCERIMKWKQLVTRFGPWHLRLPDKNSNRNHPAETRPPVPPAPTAEALSEAARQNRSFDQWCRRERGHNTDHEL